MAQKLNFCVIWGAESIAVVRFMKFGAMWEFCSKNWIRCKIVGTLTKKVRFATQTTRANLTQFISRARQEWSELAEINCQLVYRLWFKMICWVGQSSKQFTDAPPVLIFASCDVLCRTAFRIVSGTEDPPFVCHAAPLVDDRCVPVDEVAAIVRKHIHAAEQPQGRRVSCLGGPMPS